MLKNEEVSDNVIDSRRDYLVNDDKDSNGCISSDGYRWSILKSTFIRIFEIGYRLNPIQKNEDEAVISAFVIFDEDKSKVELFLPNSDKNVILNEDSEGIFKNDKYEFVANDFILKIDHVVAFEAAKEQLQNINDDSLEEIE